MPGVSDDLKQIEFQVIGLRAETSNIGTAVPGVSDDLEQIELQVVGLRAETPTSKRVCPVLQTIWNRIKL